MEDLSKLIEAVGVDDKERALMRAILREFSLNCRGKCFVKFRNLLSSYGSSNSLLIVKSAKAIADRLLCREYSEDEPRITEYIIKHLKAIKIDRTRPKLACERKLAKLNKCAVEVFNKLLKESAMSRVIAAAIAALRTYVPEDVVVKEFNLTEGMFKYVKRKAKKVEIIVQVND
jgi:hypothetical protein